MAIDGFEHPGRVPIQSRICYVHVGTHKTGTTSIQHVLTAHDKAFLAAGLHVPRAGRPDPTSGHHNIAWELNADPRFDPARGSLADVLQEIAQHGAPRACLTSEDFEYLRTRPQALQQLADGLRAIGYQPVVIMYLRPQADYAESLYAELVKFGLACRFDAFLETLVATGEFWFAERWCFTFDYERVLDAFAAVVGAAHIVARSYSGGRDDVVDDFLRVVGSAAPAESRAATVARRLNRGLRFAHVLAHLESNARQRGLAPPLRPLGTADAGGRFDPIHVGEAIRIVGRFNAGNRAVQHKYGPRVPCIGGRDLLLDVWAAIGVDPASRFRRRILAAWNETPSTAIEGSRAALLRCVRERLACLPLLAAARLDSATALTATLVAIASFVFGSQIASTTLVEFGMLSVVRAASATVSVARCAIDAHGIIADDPYLNAVGVRLRTFAYITIGFYALVNAVLDIGFSRHDPDWVSFPGEIAVAAAALILTGVLDAKRRLHPPAARPRSFFTFAHERIYTACTYAAAIVQGIHALSPVWWLDTIVDVVVTLLAFTTVARYRRAVVDHRIAA